MSRPRISIITPSYQQAPYLEACLASVREQVGVAVEHVVVDGGSTDGSKAILERHSAQLAWWCSEKDQGQSDAINKGLAHATGEVVNWVNSDDALTPGALEHVARAFEADPTLQVYGGTVVHLRGAARTPFLELNDARNEEQLYVAPVINQPATFWRTDTVRAIGGVDPALRYVMDLELWWQLLFRQGTAHLRFEPHALALFRFHDESKTTTSISGFLNETATILAGLCERSGNADLARVLREGHTMRQGLRGIPTDERQRERVRRMTLHFLLKWNGEVHHEHQFRMMRALRTVPVEEHALSAEHRQRWHRLLPDLKGNWNLFRVRRKLKHWGL